MVMDKEANDDETFLSLQRRTKEKKRFSSFKEKRREENVYFSDEMRRDRSLLGVGQEELIESKKRTIERQVGKIG